MEKSSQLLKVVFVVLVLVLFGELGFLYYSSRKSSSTSLVTPSFPLPTLKPEEAIETKLVKPFYIDMLTNIEKNPYTKYYLTEEKTGTIADLSFEPFERGKYKFLASFVLVDDNKNEIEKFSFTQNRLDFFNFYKQVGEKTQKITINDLANGQKVRFKSVIDLAINDQKDDIVSNDITVLK